MSKEIHFETNNTWIIVYANEHRHNPQLATPLCIVKTQTNVDEFDLNLHLRKISMNGYSLIYDRYFGGMENLTKQIPTFNVSTFIKTYTKTVRTKADHEEN